MRAGAARRGSHTHHATKKEGTQTDGSVRRVCLTQGLLVHVRGNLAPEPVAAYLIESKVDPSINARVVDVVGDLLERRVLPRDAERGIGQGQGMSGGAVDTAENLETAMVPLAWFDG